MGTMYSKYTEHKLKWKPLFDSLFFCVLNNIRSLHYMHRVTRGYLLNVTIYKAHIISKEATFCRMVSWRTVHIRSVKLGMVCFRMVGSL